MPKITTIYTVVSGTRHAIDLHYGITDKFHAKKLPEGMIDLPGAKEKLQGVTTIEKLESNVRDLVNVYNESRTKKRKVIIVSATLNTKTREQLGISHSHQLGQYGTQNNYGYDVSFQVAEEVEFGEKKKYHDINLLPQHFGYTIPVDSKDIIIEYTEEREATMQRIVDQTNKLGAILYAFFGDTSEQFALNVDNGVKLLG